MQPRPDRVARLYVASRGRPRGGRAGRRPGPGPGLDPAGRRHRAVARRPGRPDAPGVRVRAPARTRDRRDRAGPAPRCGPCTSAAAPGRWPATWPAPDRAPRSGWSSWTVRWPNWSAARLPVDGQGIELVVGDARAALSPGPARIARPAGARRVRRLPDPGPPDLGRVPAVRGRGARPRRGVRGQPGRRRPLDFARTQVAAAAGGARRGRAGRRRRTCCTGAGSATWCWSPVTDGCRSPSWSAGWRATRSRPGCWPGPS